jgi:hypothetical protein
VTKDVDVAAVLDNRWAPLVERVLGDLGNVAVDRIGPVSNEEILTRFARARVLVWPSRIEGHATIPWEARMMGCVPVALDSNRFAVGLDEAHGAVLVESVKEIGPAVQTLLADPARWETLSERGRRTAPQEVDWNEYVGRVRAFLDTFPDRAVSRDAAAGIGAALSGWIEERAADAQARLAEKESQIAVAEVDLTAATERQASLIHEIGHWRAVSENLTAEIENLTTAHEELRAAYERTMLRRARRAVGGAKRSVRLPTGRD